MTLDGFVWTVPQDQHGIAILDEDYVPTQSQVLGLLRQEEEQGARDDQTFDQYP